MVTLLILQTSTRHTYTTNTSDITTRHTLHYYIQNVIALRNRLNLKHFLENYCKNCFKDIPTIHRLQQNAHLLSSQGSGFIILLLQRKVATKIIFYCQYRTTVSDFVHASDFLSDNYDDDDDDDDVNNDYYYTIDECDIITRNGTKAMYEK